MKKLQTLIAAQPFFKGLTAQHLQVLADSAMEVTYKAGESIFHQGDPANRFYLIGKGQVVLEAHGEHLNRDPVKILTLGPGRELGWEWLFPPYYELFDARAVEPTQVIFFYGTRLRAQCQEDHDFGYEMMRRMAQVLIRRLQASLRQSFAPHERKVSSS